MTVKTARIVLSAGVLVAVAGLAAAVAGHPLGIGVAGPGFGAIGIGGGFLADARRASADADLALSMAAPGGMWRVWRSNGIERHVLIEAAARAFFLTTAMVFVVGLVMGFGGVKSVPSWSIWILWGGIWTVFPACALYMRRRTD